METTNFKIIFCIIFIDVWYCLIFLNLTKCNDIAKYGLYGDSLWLFCDLVTKWPKSHWQKTKLMKRSS